MVVVRPLVVKPVKELSEFVREEMLCVDVVNEDAEVGARSMYESQPFTSRFPAVTIENIIMQSMLSLIANCTLQEVRYIANMFMRRLQPGAIAIKA